VSAFVRILFLLALIVWLGEVLFLSFVAAPTMFRIFSVEEAGRAVGALFPIYYKVGAVSGALLLVTALILRAGATGRMRWTVVAVVVAVMLVATLYAGLVIQPRAQALRPQLHQAGGAPAGVKAEFDSLHRLAVQLNGVVLLGGVAVAVLTAIGLKP
jgi:preprotein translocase subunit SecY